MLSLVWMRRDLRLEDQAALATALAETGPVQPLFVFDSDILAQFPNPHDRRLSFLAATLCQLHRTLEQRGGGLLALKGSARRQIPALAAALDVSAIFSAEDMEPACRARDAAVAGELSSGVRFEQVLDHLVRHPRASVKADGSPYKVFTPFYKMWRSALGPETLAEYTVRDQGRYADFAALCRAASAAGLPLIDLSAGPDAVLAQLGYRYREDACWRVDDSQQRCAHFMQQALQPYAEARDMLAVAGTSRLSPYLRFGLVSVRSVVRQALEAGGGEKWIAELGWRDFYAAILFHFPDVVTQEFTEQYRGTLPWRHEGPELEAFCAGRTGYPIVDAAVRELLTTGFMHNRARMIVASFATKDLLIDWRVGEAFFAQHLMDYDLASNNGGWQWAASTGTDAAPYFRVFNPVLQGKRFDAAGDYIRRHVPELKKLTGDDIHAPWESLLRPADYPLPIVDHAMARERAIAVFKAARDGASPAGL